MSAAAQAALPPPPPGAVAIGSGPPPPPGAQPIGQQSVADFKAAHPNIADEDIRELNLTPPEHPEIDKLKADHPYVYGMLKSLWASDPLQPIPLEAPVAAAVQSAVKAGGQSAGDFISAVLNHPKTVAAIKDAALEWVKEIPLVKGGIKTAKAYGIIKDVVQDAKAAPTAPAPGSMTIQPTALRATTPPPLPGTPVASSTALPPSLVPKAAETAVVPRTVPPVESTAPPAAYLDQETTGLQVPQHMANRAAMAQRFVDKIGGTQNLPTNQSEWARLADDLGERVPSKETQAQIEFGLNRRMVTKTETAGTEAPTPSAVARNPKALKIAQKLQAEMESSGTATKEVPSMPVGVKGAAADIQSVGPTVPGVGATVTLKNGKTVIVKELHPDGSFEYSE